MWRSGIWKLCQSFSILFPKERHSVTSSEMEQWRWWTQELADEPKQSWLSVFLSAMELHCVNHLSFPKGNLVWQSQNRPLLPVMWDKQCELTTPMQNKCQTEFRVQEPYFFCPPFCHSHSVRNFYYKRMDVRSLPTFLAWSHGDKKRWFPYTVWVNITSSEHSHSVSH